MAAASDTRDLLVAYTPEARTIALKAGLAPRGQAVWHDPRSGQRTAAIGQRAGEIVRFEAPGEGDWVLLVRR
jgi:hypothetical protein